MIHADQAHGRATDLLREYLQDKRETWQVLLICDLFYRLRLILWSPNREWESARAEIHEKLQTAAPAYWSGDVLKGCGKNKYPDGPWQNDAWAQADAVSGTNKKLRTIGTTAHQGGLVPSA